MFCKKNNFCAVKSLIFFGGIFLVALLIGSSFFRNQSSRMTYDEALKRVQSKTVAEVNIKDNNSSTITINLGTNSSDPIFYLFQLLFWAFLLSPPVIVVLLLVIIKKMNDKGSIK